MLLSDSHKLKLGRRCDRALEGVLMGICAVVFKFGVDFSSPYNWNAVQGEYEPFHAKTRVKIGLYRAYPSKKIECFNFLSRLVMQPVSNSASAPNGLPWVMQRKKSKAQKAQRRRARALRVRTRSRRAVFEIWACHATRHWILAHSTKVLYSTNICGVTTMVCETKCCLPGKIVMYLSPK